jgi:hypothetical protein
MEVKCVNIRLIDTGSGTVATVGSVSFSVKVIYKEKERKKYEKTFYHHGSAIHDSRHVGRSDGSTI